MPSVNGSSKTGFFANNLEGLTIDLEEGLKLTINYFRKN